MNLGSLGGLFGGDERRKKLMDGLQGVMKNPEAMKAIGGLAAGGMGGAEGAGAAAGGEGGGAGTSGGFGALLGGLKTPQMGPGGTAGFNPNAPMPSLKAPMMGGDSGVRKVGRAGTGGEAFGIDNSSRGGSSGLGTPDEGGGVMVGRRISVDDAMPDAFDMPFKASQAPSPLSRMGNSTTLPTMDMNAPFVGHDPRLRNPLPQLQRPDAPVFEPIRDGVNINASNSGPVGGSDTLGSMMDQMANRPAAVENQQTQMLAPRPIGQVRPPDLLGRRGDTLDDTPMGHARYGYQSEYMDDKGHIPRRWQDIAANSLHGAAMGFQNGGGWQGALGGAAAGGVGSAVDPTRARDFRFNQEQVPRMESNRKDTERGQDRGFEMQKRNADLRGAEARTAATIAGTKDAELFRRQQEANLAKTQADTKAKLTGRPQKFLDYDSETQQYVTAFKYPDGHVEYEGPSGDAELKLRGYENQNKMNTARIEGGMARVKEAGKNSMERVRVQQGGANWRTTQTQAGQNKRTADKINAQYGDTYTPPRTPMGSDIPPQGKAPAVGSVPTKRATAQHVQEYAQKFGVSPEEARKRFEAKGYRVE
jgi:hypothetical protein